MRCPRGLLLAVFALTGAKLPLSQDGATFPGEFHVPGRGGCGGVGAGLWGLAQREATCRPGCGERGTAFAISTSFLLYPRVYTTLCIILGKVIA